MEWEPTPGEPARLICRKAQLFSKSLLELLHRKNLLGTECPLLAHSGHRLLHCTCPLSGVKRTQASAPPAVRLGSSSELWILRPVPYLHEEIPEEAENARQSFVS